MVGTIIPIGYGERSTYRFSPTVWSHAAGCLLGGLLIGACAGGAGALLGPTRLYVGGAAQILTAIVLHLGLAGRDLRLYSCRLPQSYWQVNAQWLARWPRPVAGFAFGVGLGVGVLTRIPTGLFYATLAWCVISGNAISGMMVMVWYGVGRAVPIVLLATLPRDPHAAAAVSERLGMAEPIMRLLSGLALTCSLGWILGVMSGSLR